MQFQPRLGVASKAILPKTPVGYLAQQSLQVFLELVFRRPLSPRATRFYGTLSTMSLGIIILIFTFHGFSYS